MAPRALIAGVSGIVGNNLAAHLASKGGSDSRLFMPPQEFARQRQQVHRDLGKDRAALGQPGGRERPDRDPLHSEQEVVVVEPPLRPRG